MPQIIKNLFNRVQGWTFDDTHNVLTLATGEKINFFSQNIQIDTHRSGDAAQIKIRGIDATKIISHQNNDSNRTFFVGEISVSSDFGTQDFNVWLKNEKNESWIVFLEGMTEDRKTPSVRPIILDALRYFCNNPSSVSFKWLCNDKNIVFNSATVFRIVNGSETIIKNYIELFDNRPYRGLNIQPNQAFGTNNDRDNKTNKLPLQLIYYGAPGTGKSYATNDAIENHSAIRTTFHPDSDYATFVGSYKPVSSKEYVYGLDSTGHSHQVNDSNGNAWEKDEISYKFIKQAFLKAYVNAWKLWANTCKDDKELELQFLVIEEINRGNCAQIFGDLFQLLDRKNGFSEYPIEADKDICTSLLEDDTDENPSFGKTGLVFTDAQITIINKIYDIDGKPSKEVADKIAKGKVLVLPPNFYIWATMNTSDQSLLPMDSAFKRRWKWKYIPIEQAEIGLKDNPRKWKIEADGHYCYWWEFLQAINDEIEDVSHSEDKQLGYYFCKPENGEYITAKDFVSKVIFYLWNDIFKDEDSSIFHYKELEGHWKVDGYQPKKENLYFRNFITGKESIDEKLVRWFINNLLQKKEISLLDDIDQNPIGEDIAYMRIVKNDSIENSSENIDDTRTEIHDDEEDANASV